MLWPSQSTTKSTHGDLDNTEPLASVSERMFLPQGTLRWKTIEECSISSLKWFVENITQYASLEEKPSSHGVKEHLVDLATEMKTTNLCPKKLKDSARTNLYS
jgi:hypothetical protein